MNRSETASTQPVRIGMVSLGCPKTLVDSEVILGKLDPTQYRIVTSIDDCDVALINTCTFIQDAQRESIDRILELIQLKKEKRLKQVIVMGCLVQRYSEELQKELKEVDAFIGSGDYHKIPELVQDVKAGQRVVMMGAPGYLSTANEARVALTPTHFRYLKISEGCDHICSFCSIPSFRGKHRSRSIEDGVSEAKKLIEQGAKEVILTGQDTTYFGRDWDGEFHLPALIRALDAIEGDHWFRLLYAYPACINKDLMMAIRDAKHFCRYLDMPLQHASDAMLLAMRRGITKRRTIDLINQFREIVPELTIRTTFIAGFPGETEKDHEELAEFIQEMQFERVGIFQYSQEDGTHSSGLSRQVPEKVKQARLDRLMQLQQEISFQNLKRFQGKTLKVLIDGISPDDEKVWIGRSYLDAPEIDGNVFVSASDQPLQVGAFYLVKITSTQEYDLVGQVE